VFFSQKNHPEPAGRPPVASPSPRGSRAGFTIIEILITLVLVTLLFIPIVQLMQLGTKRVYRGGDETLATIYAADIIELIRGGPYEAFYENGQKEEKGLDLKEVFGRSPFFKGYDPSSYIDRFTIAVDVGPAGEIPPKKLKQVRVTVAWKERTTENPKSIKMVTFYSPSTL